MQIFCFTHCKHRVMIIKNNSESERIMKKMISPVPPMGWNSFDAFGSSVTEEQFKANVDFMAEQLKPLGWEYAVVDFCWSHPDPGAVANPDLVYAEDGSSTPELAMDHYGRLIPDPGRFPSSVGGDGFKPLSDYVHSKGLKFGIHIMRGIPRSAVYRNSPILGSDKTAADIADPANYCRWLNHNYGVDMDKEGSQAYYDSIFTLYESWDVDFIKADDLTYLHAQPGLNPGDDQYAAREIAAIGRACANTERDMILSLSCGPTSFNQAEHVDKYSHMWRITQDFWDEWGSLKELFYYCRGWAPLRKAHGWPDADMIPFGRLSLCGPKGEPRYSRFTDNEKLVLMTLLALFRSPLILGGDLPQIDETSLKLVTNRKIVRINQLGQGSREILNNGTSLIWLSEDSENGNMYAAFFNLHDDYSIQPDMSALRKELSEQNYASVIDIWQNKRYKSLADLKNSTILPHSCLLLELERIEGGLN